MGRKKIIYTIEEIRRRNAVNHLRWANKHRENLRNYERKRNNTGENYNADEVVFYNYKEPLKPYAEGFGYEGVIIFNKAKDKIQCHLCGKFYRALNNGHLGKIHGMTAGEYKKLLGLRQTAALVGEGTREKLIHRLDTMPQSWFDAKMVFMKKAQRTNPPSKFGHKLRLEHKNLRGTCPNQLLEKIKVLANKLKKAPTGEEFLKEYNGKFMGSIRNTFGTYENAVRQAGLIPMREIRAQKYNALNLLNYLKIFYKIHKRSPTDSDFRRGILPDFNVYSKKFGSINRAKLLANIPILIHIGKWKYENWMPTSEERDTMLKYGCNSLKDLRSLSK